MEVVYPPNYPEPGDLYAALADAISTFLEKRGQTMLNKAKSQSMRYSAANDWVIFFPCPSTVSFHPLKGCTTIWKRQNGNRSGGHRLASVCRYVAPPDHLSASCTVAPTCTSAPSIRKNPHSCFCTRAITTVKCGRIHARGDTHFLFSTYVCL